MFPLDELTPATDWPVVNCNLLDRKAYWEKYTGPRGNTAPRVSVRRDPELEASTVSVQANAHTTCWVVLPRFMTSSNSR